MENVKKNYSNENAQSRRVTIIKNLEKAAICKDIRERQIIDQLVAGGGPTGVEVSGMYAEKSIFQKEYPELGTSASTLFS
jgi:NADH dehydrogenase